MNNKKIIMGGIILVVLILFGGLFLFTKQEDKLEREIKKINSLTDEEKINEKKLNKLLDRRIINGEFAKVEDGVKNYLKDVVKDTISLRNIFNSDDFVNLLEIGNINNDKPHFNKSREVVKNLKEEIGLYKERILNNLDKEKVLSYIDEEKFNDYERELYLKLIYGEESEDKLKEDFVKEIDEALKKLDIVIDVYDFLEKYQRSWGIENGNIIFNDYSLINEYEKIIGNL